MDIENTAINDLRELVSFLEAHPDIDNYSPNQYIACFNKESMLRVASLPGARKLYDSDTLTITVPITRTFTLRFFASRDAVCTAKRTEMVVIPARHARVIEKVVEWDCHPLLKPREEETNGE